MKERQKNHNQDDSSAFEHVQMQSRTSSSQSQKHSQASTTQTPDEQSFQQHQLEAQKLQVKGKHATLTPGEQQQLTTLQTKMNDALQTKEENSSLGHNLANISINRPGTLKEKQPINKKEELEQNSEDDVLQMMPDTQDKASASASKELSEQKQGANRNKFKQDYPLVQELVDKIDPAQPHEKILEQLFNNFQKINFIYTAQYKKPETLLKGAKEGDCKTLTETFQTVAKEYFGITNITIGEIKEPFVSEAGKTPHKGKEPNCDFDGSKKGWFFQNHYWAVWNNKVYDVLFLSHKAPEIDKAKQKDPLKSMLMPEGEYYETEKGKVVYPVGVRYSTVQLSVFQKAQNFMKNLSGSLARQGSEIARSIKSFLTRGSRDDSGLDSLLGGLKKQAAPGENE
ncbi:hypothetical protein [Nostoc sp. FACHB-888]|uniref:hypothetical protein n=1 Tax=Nostoc sp. FACHB-888 TaxID=2692842 RepID=UPI001682A33A|nr:hypothetical protein [Nostoc sp. FACHB-888]MBD2245319.1 hypothetical protein [Nostoc sp. FACHB-888]